jgi:hypothetical protein
MIQSFLGYEQQLNFRIENEAAAAAIAYGCGSAYG